MTVFHQLKMTNVSLSVLSVQSLQESLPAVW